VQNWNAANTMNTIKPMCVCGEPMSGLHRLSHVLSYEYDIYITHEAQNADNENKP